MDVWIDHGQISSLSDRSPLLLKYNPAEMLHGNSGFPPSGKNLENLENGKSIFQTLKNQGI